MRRPGLLGVVLAASCAAGCLIQIDHCTNPAAAFREARLEAQRHEGRSGRAGQVNILVFDPSEEKLIRVSVPIWLAKKAYHVAEGDEDGFEIDFGGEGEEQMARQLRRRVRFEDLERAGPGVLVEVDEDDGEQVLVWLR
jgi:hypothetical protein